MKATDEKPLRVAMVIDVYDNARNGASISTDRFTSLLREKGHTVTVVTTGEAGPGKLVMGEFYPPLFKWHMQNMNFVFAWPRRREIRNLLRKIDILHNQMPFLLSIRSIGLARAAGVPVISTFHVQAEQIVNNTWLKHLFLVNFVYRVIIHFVYNRSDLVICPSQFAADEIRRRGCRTPTVVISNGVTPEYRVLETQNRDPDKFVILTVGRNAIEKRQDLIIEAVAHSKYRDRIKLQIAGTGTLRAKLEQMSHDLLDGRVEFLYVPPSELIDYYNAADLYVHAAEVEVECMTALEAMACGLPLLISNSKLSATKQFALGKECLYNSREELTQKIDYWYEHREALARKREDYLEFVNQFRIEDSLEKLEAAYRRVLRASRVAKKSESFWMG